MPPIPYGKQVLKEDRLDPSTRPTCICYLARVCGWHVLLPKSAEISGHEAEAEAIGGSGYSTVFSGSYNSRKVVIKVLRIFEGDEGAQKKEITRVCRQVIVWWQQNIDTCSRVIQVFFKEVITWKNLDHPNLLPFVGAKVEPMQGAWKYEIISEFMGNGPISMFVRQNQGVNQPKLVSFDLRPAYPIEWHRLPSVGIVKGRRCGVEVLALATGGTW